MANDSIIARPTNTVRVMVAEASGCCASEVSAVATARPSPSAGHMQPTPIVRPAVAIETIATSVLLSIGSPLHGRVRFACQGGGRDVNPGQNTKDVCLHHAGKQAQHSHDDRK